MGLYVISTPAGCGSDLKKYGVKLVPYNNILKLSAEIEKAIVYKNKMSSGINLSNKIYRFSYTYLVGITATTLVILDFLTIIFGSFFFTRFSHLIKEL